MLWLFYVGVLKYGRKEERETENIKVRRKGG